MKRVTRTKGPSITQLRNMVLNLAEGTTSVVSIEYQPTRHSSGEFKERYWFYTADGNSEYLYTWEEVQDKYFRLMEGK